MGGDLDSEGGSVKVDAKWAAITELAPAKILFRPEGQTFYVSQCGVEVAERPGILTSPTQLAPTAATAVLEYFTQLTAKSPVVVVGAYSDDRREFRWNPITEAWQSPDAEIDATALLAAL